MAGHAGAEDTALMGADSELSGTLRLDSGWPVKRPGFSPVEAAVPTNTEEGALVGTMAPIQTDLEAFPSLLSLHRCSTERLLPS